MANGQISVSRETLRAELASLQLSLSTALAQLELRLIDRLADKATVAALDSRVANMERTALVKGGPIFDEVHNLEKRVLTIEALDPAGLKADCGDERKKVRSLEDWRNRIIGGLLVVSSVAALNFVRIWFGIG